MFEHNDIRCPVCNGNSVIVLHHKTDDYSKVYGTVMCAGCGVGFPRIKFRMDKDMIDIYGYYKVHSDEDEEEVNKQIGNCISKLQRYLNK